MLLPTVERLRTMALLRRFFGAALAVGRMPSLLGREVFRQSVSALPTRAFEDSVLFVCDVESCLRSLHPFDQRLIAFCVLEGYSEWEAARRFRDSQTEISRRLADALDRLHETFCRLGLLTSLPAVLRQSNFTNPPSRGTGESHER
jgi:hypothetical protein